MFHKQELRIQFVVLCVFVGIKQKVVKEGELEST